MAGSSPVPDIDRRGKTEQWTLDCFECPSLKSRNILSLGYSEAGEGYQVVRRNPGFSNINLTISGKAEALVNGRWSQIKAGTAVLSPKGVLHGARSLAGIRWEFCWICFAEPAAGRQWITVRAPTFVHTDPRPVAWTLLSLHREMRQARHKEIIEILLQLLDSYLRRITVPMPMENHLWKLWEKVAQSPAHPWTDEEMAREVHLSPRHLLRLCRKESGRTARQQLAHTRLTKAASLLQDRSQKLQTIAEAVGYQDAFAFSKAFKRWSGVSPKAYRAGY